MSEDLTNKFWKVFERSLGRRFPRDRQLAAATEEWDSLKHVELIFELEQQFDIEISPDDIARLFSDTDTILQYLRDREV